MTLSHLFRTLCVSLCVALVALLSLHGVEEGRHQIAHVSNWPAVAIDHHDQVEIADVDHGALHTHVVPGALANDPLDQAESSDGDGDAGHPASHHHHSSGDNHTAIPALDRDLNPLLAINVALLPPAVDGAHPAHNGDGPEYPPKRTRTII